MWWESYFGEDISGEKEPGLQDQERASQAEGNSKPKTKTVKQVWHDQEIGSMLQ